MNWSSIRGFVAGGSVEAAELGDGLAEHEKEMVWLALLQLYGKEKKVALVESFVLLVLEVEPEGWRMELVERKLVAAAISLSFWFGFAGREPVQPD